MKLGIGVILILYLKTRKHVTGQKTISKAQNHIHILYLNQISFLTILKRSIAFLGLNKSMPCLRFTYSFSLLSTFHLLGSWHCRFLNQDQGLKNDLQELFAIENCPH